MQENWDSTYSQIPQDPDLAGLGAAAIRSLKYGSWERLSQEHEWPVGAGANQGRHGLHRKGSAFLWVGATLPAVRPSGVALDTSVTALDDGMLALLTADVDSTHKAGLYVWRYAASDGVGKWRSASNVDWLFELTDTHGVNVDGVLLRDGQLSATTRNLLHATIGAYILSGATQAQVDAALAASINVLSGDLSLGGKLTATVTNIGTDTVGLETNGAVKAKTLRLNVGAPATPVDGDIWLE